MRVFMFALSLLLAWPVGAIAQERTAEDGDYPPTYQGATFTGVVSAVNKATGEITLTYTAPNPKNSETFVGVLEKGYTVKLADGSKQPLLAAKIPGGRSNEGVLPAISEKNRRQESDGQRDLQH